MHARMFQLSIGMSQEEFYARPTDRESLLNRGIRPALKTHTPSDDEDVHTLDTSDVEFNRSSWNSGCDERDRAQALQRWPDGAALGRGHGAPYLRREYAKMMHDGKLRVVGRPNSGVRSILC